MSDWRTILVAGLNSGGRGYYALDVTNPLAPKALWEFTNSTFCVTTDDPGNASDDVTVPDFTTPVGGDLKSDCNVGLIVRQPDHRQAQARTASGWCSSPRATTTT